MCMNKVEICSGNKSKMKKESKNEKVGFEVVRCEKLILGTKAAAECTGVQNLQRLHSSLRQGRLDHSRAR
jgi:hypothetical protein